MYRSALKLRVSEQIMKKCHFLYMLLNFASGPTDFWSILASYMGISLFLLFLRNYICFQGGSRVNFLVQYASICSNHDFAHFWRIIKILPRLLKGWPGPLRDSPEPLKSLSETCLGLTGAS